MRRLAEREYALTARLHHPGILAPKDIVEDEFGSGLVFPYDPQDQRLDLWLADARVEVMIRSFTARLKTDGSADPSSSTEDPHDVVTRDLACLLVTQAIDQLAVEGAV